MSTHALGIGTCNLSINVRKEVRARLGRAAFVRDVSMGELCRRIFHRAGFLVGATKFALAAGRDDLEAVTILRTAIADGITEDDRPAIERAIKLILRSGECDARLAANLNLSADA